MFRNKDFEIPRIELKKLVNVLPYPLAIYEMKQGTDQIFFLNTRFVSQIGYTLRDVRTRMDLAVMLYPDENYRNEVLNNWRSQEEKIRKKGKGFIKMKVHICCKSREKRWFVIKASIVNDVYVVAYVDINSDMMLQEKLKKINFQNDMMLSIFGHDLRGPVANLIAVCSMAENTDIPKKEYISIIGMVREEASEVLELLDTSLNWARQNFNTLAQNPVEIDFNVMIMGVLKSFRSSYEKKSIKVTVEVEKLYGIRNDLEILTIIVRNIIANAIKFTPRNGLITISSEERELIISDNGIGMQESRLKRILNQDYVSSRGTENEKGIGLGLRLVFSLAANNNCSIKIESKEAKGTKVRIIFDAINPYTH